MDIEKIIREYTATMTHMSLATCTNSKSWEITKGVKAVFIANFALQKPSRVY